MNCSVRQNKVILLAITLLLVGTVIGMWRHFACRIRAISKANTPAAWLIPGIRYGTLAAVVGCSVVGATILSVRISESHYWLGRIMWGVILMARWQTSWILCHVVWASEIKAVEEDHRKRWEETMAQDLELSEIRKMTESGQASLTEILKAGEKKEAKKAPPNRP